VKFIASIRELAASGVEFTIRDLRARFGKGCHAQSCQHLERRGELTSSKTHGRGRMGVVKVYRRPRDRGPL
jgi:hypothetical protein